MPNVPRATRAERSPIRFATPYLEVETRSVSSLEQVEGRRSALVYPNQEQRRFSRAGLKREREARERDELRRDELDRPAQVGRRRRTKFGPPLGGELRTDMSPSERPGGTRNATTCQ
jgi:hypothetical protein